MRRTPAAIRPLQLPRALWIFLAVFLIACPSAFGITMNYQITGVISQFRLQNATEYGDSFSDFGITAGDVFQGFLSYDLPLEDTDGRYALTDRADQWANSFLTLEVRDQTFIVPYKVFATVINGPEFDYLRFDFGGSFGQGIVQSAWETTPDELNTHGGDTFSMYLSDLAGAALTSENLPEALDITEWTENQLWLHGNISWSTFDLHGTITEIRRVPETGNTALLLLWTCLAMSAFSFRNSARR